MAFNVNDMRAQLVFGGYRNANFQVQISNPANSTGDIKIPFMVKAAQLPSSTLGFVDVPYFGRKIKVAGDRTYEEWTVTVINDEDFLVRNALEEWSHAINSPEGNLRGFGSASPLLYQSQGIVTAFSKTGVPLREYKFNNIWPSLVSSIDLAWETTDTISEFQVTFQYDYWTVSGLTGNAGT